MKNQLCKPCDYRRAFALCLKARNIPVFMPVTPADHAELLQTFKRYWPIRPAKPPFVPPNSYLQEWRFRPWCEYWPIWFFYRMKWYYKCGGDKIEQPW